MSKRKYRILFSSKALRRPGPKGPGKDLIDAVIAMEQRNPSWGCPRIAQQICLVFGVEIDKGVVRRILSVHYRCTPQKVFSVSRSDYLEPVLMMKSAENGRTSNGMSRRNPMPMSALLREWT